MTDVIPAPAQTDEPEHEATDAAEPRPPSRILMTLLSVALYIVCVIAALSVGAGIVALTGGSWFDVYTKLIEGSVSNPRRWGGTLAVAAPMLLVALGTVVSSRAGLINIGQEG